MPDYSDQLTGTPQPLSRSDVMMNWFVPDWLKGVIRQPAPPAMPPGGQEGKVPEDRSTAWAGLPDALSWLPGPEGKLAATGAGKLTGMLAHNPQLAAIMLGKAHVYADYPEAKQIWHNLIDDKKGVVGGLDLSWLPNDKELYVNNIKSNLPSPESLSMKARIANNKSQSLGHQDIKDVLRALKEQYPDAEQIRGFRISGARSLWGGNQNAVMPLKPGVKAKERESKQFDLQDALSRIQQADERPEISNRAFEEALARVRAMEGR